MKFSAFSLIAMFMVTANALVVPMDSMGDASGLVKRQDSDPKPNPAAPSSSPTPTEDAKPMLTPVFMRTPTPTPPAFSASL
ncbi:hypothetical protein BASA50_010090 [Batrachochytrium salamandrivorans]|uniref:Uncharacterized protein n=1 Tax=Batrachochytrium salamandrivorans TaxID=1357716 RepID=A0ABQ8EZX2_9FUNG|nr:hypothetical protein BASA62_006285 [Batrachochytrium salamandrivorans]KAH6582770.1 hypothetical protein BASA60_001764 [Batrachochytrium salamandrivorans]KAH6589344.1 hypothetical protein BASA50_010090 [Batrachochytrium salamandrivorans]KAH9268097.1 hypothetical protein BASA83_009486 [Batrachochytrium salamandrivorans]